MSTDLNLSVIIPAMTKTEGLALLLRELRRELNSLGVSSEILVVVDRPDPQILALASEQDARALEQPGRTYGAALQAAFDTAAGTYLLTLDPDLFRRPTFIAALWSRRLEGEITIASRYVKGGAALIPSSRRFLSRLLNAVFSRGLSLRIRDMSSANRLYRADLVRGRDYQARDVDILQEILVRAYMDAGESRRSPSSTSPGPRTRPRSAFSASGSRTSRQRGQQLRHLDAPFPLGAGSSELQSLAVQGR